MRVTNKMMSDNMLRNLNTNLRDMNHTQNKLSTGKRILSPSDDPAGTARTLDLRTEETELAKYKQNVDDADSWLTSTDSALDEVDDVLQRVRELTIYAASDSVDQQSREALAAEVMELKEHLVEVANTDFGGKHIFGGHNTTDKPFDMDDVEEMNGEEGEYNTFDVEYSGNRGRLNTDISSDVTISKNLHGEEVFGSFDEEENGENGENGDEAISQNMFKMLDGVYDSMMEDDGGGTEKLSNEHLQDLDHWIENNLDNRAEVGARQNRLELSKNRLQDIEHLTKEDLSETEEADMAKTIMDLKSQENVHRMALSAGARIIQPTLLDFLQ
ncbi:flagellar hook-associated protein FlgL [Natranaerobius thermophilus]|uniref:Flagellar hook-associated protein 3 n=1 Tax=Natranaerobius thermophilus (strain ATCC BAA-1301 / DSM 18059 / JW/NM-WN-LF) TaxID=457570 RepID=B2A833_NATTJ|nr:flagellar hook-associated protein FlgL [Natranaerobius thermophilus]ACB85801.1 flagellar hook-associated protein 3 [Natranaerobius thermophilus JW/NM-WN-LF]